MPTGTLDQNILIISGLSFFTFIVLQMIFFRWAHAQAVLKWIMISFWLSSLAHVFWVWRILDPQTVQTWQAAFWLAACVSYVIFGLMSFVYILCVFGPSETSIRIRILRELKNARGHVLTRDQLLSRYNAQVVIDRRITRLLKSGEIVESGARLILSKKTNAFFVIDAATCLIRNLIEKKS